MHLLASVLIFGCSSSEKGRDSSLPSSDDSVAASDVDGDGIDAPADCDDTDEAIHPDAHEVVADGIDQDCDGNDLCYVDADDDGYGTGETIAAASCDGSGVARASSDCDDADAARSPAAPEVTADGIDQNCDGGDDCFADADADGFGSHDVLSSKDLDCTDPGEGTNSDDCLDSGPAAAFTFPGAAPSDSETECMTDADDDRYGSETPVKGVAVGRDCDDADPLETCVIVHVGHDTLFAGASNHSANYLAGFEIEVETTMLVTHLAVVAKEASPSIRMALYSDAEGPDALLIEVPSTAMAGGENEFPVTPFPIEPGHYWIMAMYEEDASVGIYSPGTGAKVTYKYMPFADPLPDPFGEGNDVKNQVYNYYLVGF
jgi:hypothetical protein